MSSDEELVQQAVGGDRSALERLLQQCHRPLRRRVEQRISPALAGKVCADDVLQETFAEAFRRIRDFQPRGEGTFLGWLSCIADHRLADMIKACRTAKRGGERVAVGAPLNPEVSTIVDVLALLAVHEATPSRSVARREAVEAVRSALLGLSADYRRALELRYLRGLPVAEIAAQMNRTPRAVHMLCNRGLKALHAALGDASRFLTRPG